MKLWYDIWILRYGDRDIDRCIQYVYIYIYYNNIYIILYIFIYKYIYYVLSVYVHSISQFGFQHLHLTAAPLWGPGTPLTPGRLFVAFRGWMKSYEILFCWLPGSFMIFPHPWSPPLWLGRSRPSFRCPCPAPVMWPTGWPNDETWPSSISNTNLKMLKSWNLGWVKHPRDSTKEMAKSLVDLPGSETRGNRDVLEASTATRQSLVHLEIAG